MTHALTIALDAMGGDDAPEMVIEGAAIARERLPQARFLIFGNETKVAPLLGRHAELARVSEIRHTNIAISNDDKPGNALRSGRGSSMRLAIDAVKEGEADCVVSAGNTGALVATAKYVLRTLPGIDRPAMASIFPTDRGETVMLDLGANIECGTDNLVQFAIMGTVFARIVLGIERPSCGLLNIGVEELKGRETIRQAAAILKAQPDSLNYCGFVEGDGITRGDADVVVTDGFTGNVALKTAEGTARFVLNALRASVKSSLLAKLGFLIAAGAFKSLRRRMDPRRYNGAMLLGLNGVCVKSHGGTDAFGFAHATTVAADLAVNRFNEKIAADLARLAAPPPEDMVAATERDSPAADAVAL